ncbi:MAG: hypothetical protein WD883_00050 [Candidatus Colwellbacteria bacterium]
MAGEIHINGKSTDPVSLPTPKLLDEEARLASEKRALISKVTLEVEAVFLREDMDMGDLLEVFGLLTNRANEVFSLIKIKTIKEKHGNI